jgi:hypothetical protein
MNNEGTNILHHYNTNRFEKNSKRLCDEWSLVIQEVNDIGMIQKPRPTYAICGNIFHENQISIKWSFGLR